MAKQRQYWVVSPNVKNSEKTVAAWKKEILSTRATIMGWAPDDYGHNQIGPKFAGKTRNSIQLDDIVLIARCYKGRPDVVGFGVVKSECRPDRLPPSDDDVYLRDLKPFRPWSQPPAGIPLIDVLQHTRALVQLHPEEKGAHSTVCDWMARQLRLGDEEVGDEETTSRTTEVRTSNITERDLHESTFGYKVKTKRQVIQARKVEAGLVRDYKRWLEKRGRKLTRLTFNKLQCDAWEEESKNLIEAKGSTSREDIRMAVGQLLDYAFQGKEKFKELHLAILLPDEPAPDSVKWLAPLDIKIIWRKGRAFLDNADGQFTMD